VKHNKIDYNYITFLIKVYFISIPSTLQLNYEYITRTLHVYFEYTIIISKSYYKYTTIILCDQPWQKGGMWQHL